MCGLLFRFFIVSVRILFLFTAESYFILCMHHLSFSRHASVAAQPTANLSCCKTSCCAGDPPKADILHMFSQEWKNS